MKKFQLKKGNTLYLISSGNHFEDYQIADLKKFKDINIISFEHGQQININDNQLKNLEKGESVHIEGYTISLDENLIKIKSNKKMKNHKLKEGEYLYLIDNSVEKPTAVMYQMLKINKNKLSEQTDIDLEENILLSIDNDDIEKLESGKTTTAGDYTIAIVEITYEEKFDDELKNVLKQNNMESRDKIYFLVDDKNKIISSYEYIEDAQKDLGVLPKSKKAKIVSKRELSSMSIDNENPEHWAHDYSIHKQTIENAVETYLHAVQQIKNYSNASGVDASNIDKHVANVKNAMREKNYAIILATLELQLIKTAQLLMKSRELLLPNDVDYDIQQIDRNTRSTIEFIKSKIS